MVDQKSCIWGTVVVALVVRYTYFGRNLNMSWTNKIFRSVSLEPIREKQMPAGKSQSMGSSRDLDAQAGVQKLRQAHDLAKDALESAYEADVDGDVPHALQRYRAGAEAIEIGLRVDAPETGLGQRFNNSAQWKHELREWQQHVQDRLRDLESPEASSSNGAPRREATRITRHTGFTPTRKTQARPQPAAVRRGPVPGRGGTGGKRASAPPAGGVDDAKMREIILAEVLDHRPSVRWQDVAGLANAKQALHEMVILPALRADLFRGLRAPAKGLLLYGPPGNGKTLLAKALANEGKSTFFNISASSLTSKWHGEAEKLVRTLFAVAAEMQPSIIFIDEIDSILSERSSGEHEASRRLKTQFLVEFDGVAQASNSVVVIGATNRPQELDDAVRRRLVKRIYIPMPDAEGRRSLLKHTLEDQPMKLSATDLERLVQVTEGYSGSDLAALCREAAMQPIRELGSRVTDVPAHKIRPMRISDFQAAMNSIRPSVSQNQMRGFEEWTREYGSNA